MEKIRAKKSLGQNFLRKGFVLNKIISTAQIAKGDTVLEIGPGKGSLTEKLLKSGAKVVAVEKDQRLIIHLQEKLSEEISSNQLTLIQEDILETGADTLGLKKYKLVANIPYYISGRILEKFLEEKIKPTLMVLMLQNEVAKRITNSIKESVLSVFVKTYGKPKYISRVSAKFFSPVPKVDSAIVLIDKIKNPFESKDQENLFKKIVKEGFRHKRKFLISNLFDYKKDRLVKIFNKLGIENNTRPENVSVNQWLQIAKKLRG
jgi:16S rRNA (adenine1518-N6/adenine1519-N6)-dimethyltransferase